MRTVIEVTDRAPASMSDSEIAEEVAAIYKRLDQLEAEFNRRNPGPPRRG